MDEKLLFEDLADQAGPQRPRGKPRLQEPRRDAVALRVVDLEELVAADDPVRDVWAYVERLDLSALYGLVEILEFLLMIQTEQDLLELGGVYFLRRLAPRGHRQPEDAPNDTRQFQHSPAPVIHDLNPRLFWLSNS